MAFFGTLKGPMISTEQFWTLQSSPLVPRIVPLCWKVRTIVGISRCCITWLPGLNSCNSWIAGSQSPFYWDPTSNDWQFDVTQVTYHTILSSNINIPRACLPKSPYLVGLIAKNDSACCSSSELSGYIPLYTHISGDYIDYINGNFRILNFRNIPTKYGLIWYSTSNLGSWNYHWLHNPHRFFLTHGHLQLLALIRGDLEATGTPHCWRLLSRSEPGSRELMGWWADGCFMVIFHISLHQNMSNILSEYIYMYIHMVIFGDIYTYS